MHSRILNPVDFFFNAVKCKLLPVTAPFVPFHCDTKFENIYIRNYVLHHLFKNCDFLTVAKLPTTSGRTFSTDQITVH